jgi:hypothetical protein
MWLRLLYLESGRCKKHKLKSQTEGGRRFFSVSAVAVSVFAGPIGVLLILHIIYFLWCFFWSLLRCFYIFIFLVSSGELPAVDQADLQNSYRVYLSPLRWTGGEFSAFQASFEVTVVLCRIRSPDSGDRLTKVYFNNLADSLTIVCQCSCMNHLSSHRKSFHFWSNKHIGEKQTVFL